MSRLSKNVDSSDGELRSPKLPDKLSTRLPTTKTAEIPETTDIPVAFSEKIEIIQCQIKNLLNRIVDSEGNITLIQKSDNDRKDVSKQLNENQEELAARCTTVKNIANLNSERIRELLTDVAKLPVLLKNTKIIENSENTKNPIDLEKPETTNNPKTNVSSDKIPQLENDILTNKKLLLEKFEQCLEGVKFNSKSYKNMEINLATKHQEAIDTINKHSHILNDCEPSDLNRENFQLDLFGKPSSYNSFVKIRPLFQAMQDVITCTKHQFEHHWSNIQNLDSNLKTFERKMLERNLDSAIGNASRIGYNNTMVMPNKNYGTVVYPGMANYGNNQNMGVAIPINNTNSNNTNFGPNRAINAGNSSDNLPTLHPQPNNNNNNNTVAHPQYRSDISPSDMPPLRQNPSHNHEMQ